ncbi:MAG: hypothetical protein ACLFMS_05275 [Halorhodospira sp.]
MKPREHSTIALTRAAGDSLRRLPNEKKKLEALTALKAGDSQPSPGA